MRVGLIIIIGLLVIYPPLELSRLILAYPGFDAEFIAELFFIWGTYALAITLLTIAVLRR